MTQVHPLSGVERIIQLLAINESTKGEYYPHDFIITEYENGIYCPTKQE